LQRPRERRGTRDRPSARPVRPSVGRRHSGRSRAPSTPARLPRRGPRFARERDEPIQAAGRAAEPREPAGHSARTRATPARRTEAGRHRRADSRPARGQHASEGHDGIRLNRRFPCVQVAVSARRAPRTRGRFVPSHRRELPTWKKNRRQALAFATAWGNGHRPESASARTSCCTRHYRISDRTSVLLD